MTFGKLALVTILLWIALAIEKVVFYKILDGTSIGISIVWGMVTLITALAAVRRLGVLNFLEAGFVSVLWFIIFLVLDFIILSPLMGAGFFGHLTIWMNYVMVMVAVMFFHKKRHIQIRHEQLAHHGHGHGNSHGHGLNHDAGNKHHK